MKSPTTPKPASRAEQHKRFIETACQLKCDEDQERFEEKLGRIATQRPAKPNETKSKRVK